MVTKALYIFLPRIHPFIHWQGCQPYKAPSSSSGVTGVRRLAHGHLDTWSGGSRVWTTNLPIWRQPTWITQPLPSHILVQVLAVKTHPNQIHMLATKVLHLDCSIIGDVYKTYCIKRISFSSKFTHSHSHLTVIHYILNNKSVCSFRKQHNA